MDRIFNYNQLVIEMPNLGRYDLYKYDYLTSRESECLTSVEIFWQEINLI